MLSSLSFRWSHHYYLHPLWRAAPAANSNGDAFLIGSAEEAGVGTLPWQPFYGQIDEVTVYGRVLSGLEIEDLYWLEWRWFREQGYFNVTVDTDDPTISMLNEATHYPNGYNMLAVAADDVNGARLFEWAIRPIGGSFTWQSAYACGFNKWCPDFDSTLLGGEGTYELQFRVVDTVGRETISDITTIEVDSSAPVASSGYSDTWVTATRHDRTQWSLPLSVTVNDPVLSGGAVGSGVDDTSVRINLYTTRNTPVGESVLATFESGSWVVDYPFYNFAPSGEYQIEVTAADMVGNESTSMVGTVVVDAQSPLARLKPGVIETDVISDTAVLSGISVEQPDWGGAVAEYHFETSGNAFIDYSGNGETAVCTDCPTVVSGFFGNGLSFQTATDFVTVPALLDTTDDAFTAAFWFQTDSVNNTKTLIQQTDGTDNSGQIWLALADDKLRSDLGGTALQSEPELVTAGDWHHAAVSYDGETVRLYLDGELVAAENRTVAVHDGELWLGIDKTNSDPFIGLLDAHFFYDRALSANEIYLLGQDRVQGVDGVEVWLEPIDAGSEACTDAASSFVTLANGSTVTSINATPPADNGWVTAVYADGSWEYTIPDRTEWFYQIHLRSSDVLNNSDDAGIVWRGTIDNLAPRITLNGELMGNGTTAYTEYSFTVTDFLLDPNSLEHMCDESDLTVTLYDVTEASPLFGQTYEISGTCKVNGHDDGTSTITSCDLGGLCNIGRIELSDPPDLTGSVIITSPAHNSVISTTVPVALEGAAFTLDGIAQVSVMANGIPVDTVSLGGVTDSLWSMEWFPTEPGAYTLTAVMTDTLNATFTDTVDVTLVGNVLDVTNIGTGSGTVTSEPAGIACPDDCEEPYMAGTVVTLTVTVDASSTFDGWSGACTGTDACVVTMDAAKSVTATINFQEQNFPPIILSDAAITDEDTAVTIDVLANDSDPNGDSLQIESITAPANGTAEIVSNMVVYTPTLNFNGEDSFSYIANDGNGAADTATVTVTVTAVNDLPTGIDDNVTIDEDTATTIDVLANDQDADGDTLIVETVTQPMNGTAVISGTLVVYTPTVGFTGSDSFTYTINDGNGGTDSAIVTITVTPVTNEMLYFSSHINSSFGDVAYRDEDIISFDTVTGEFALYFDGSDVGLNSVDIDAFHVMDDGAILMSFDRLITVSGAGRVNDSDIVKFIPTALGEDTAGVFELYLDGSDVGLTTNGEDIDAIGFTEDGRLVISTLGNYQVPQTGGGNLRGYNEHLIAFNDVSLGSNSSGTWELYFDGQDVGLIREDIGGTWIDAETGDIYLSVKKRFAIDGVNGNQLSIFICQPITLGGNTSCTFDPDLYFDGSKDGHRPDQIDGFSIVR